MGCPIKVVTAVASIGLIVAGAITGNFQMIAVGASLGASLLAPKPKAPTVSPAAADRLFASIDTRASRKIVFGHTAMATDIRDQELTDGQTYLHRFVAAASHKATAFEQVWFDDKLAWTAGGGAQGDFAGYLTITPILEGSAANAINISARMGSTRRYTGLAYLHIRYKLTGNSKKSDSPFAQSIPSRVTIVGKGAPVYDPRLDSTAGGSGAHRAGDQTTWTWSDEASRNPALQLLWYLLGWRIKNPVTNEWKLVVGKGIPPARIDIGSFITAANLCDELVAKAAGGTEARYRSDGVFSESDDPSLVLDNLKASMNAVLDDVDGKIRVTVLHNDLGSPVRALVTADVLGEFKWGQSPPLSDTFNVIRGGYTDPSNTSLYQQVDYPEVRIASPDGIDRIQTVNLPMVQSPSQAQRLVKQRLQRQLYAGIFQATFQATAWQYLKGDVVPFTFAPLGWVNKLFRIIDIQVQLDGTVPMTLREEHPDIYLWEATDAPAVQGAAPTTYDYQLNPVYQDIQEIASSVSALLTNENHTVPADADGNVTSYADAAGNFVVYSGATDVSGGFTLATKSGGNPQGLAVTYTDMHYAVTGGLDAGEDSATLTIVATGTGVYAGVTVEKVFSLGKSRAGGDGTPAKLITLTPSSLTAKYDETGAYVGGAIDFAAARQNAAGPTIWGLYNAAGALVFSGPASAYVGADPTAWSSSDGDHLTPSATGVVALMATYGGAFSIEAVAGTVSDRVRIIKIQDGADGVNGIPGPPGANGQTSYFHLAYADSSDGTSNFSFSPGTRPYIGVYVDFTATSSTLPASYAWSLIKGADGSAGSPGAPGVSPVSATVSTATVVVEADANGITKPSQLNQTVTLVVVQGATVVTGSASVTLTYSDSAAITASYSGGVLTITKADAPGWVDMAVTFAGSAVQTFRITINRPRDNPPPATATSAARDLSGFGLATSTSYGTDFFPIGQSIPANASGQLIMGASMTYTPGGPNTNMTYAAYGKMTYSSTAGGARTDAGAEVSGSSSQIVSGNVTAVGGLNVSYTVSGLTPGAYYFVWFEVRKRLGATGVGGAIEDGQTSVRQ